jgi:hypothetical protein
MEVEREGVGLGGEHKRSIGGTADTHQDAQASHPTHEHPD